MDLGFPSEAIAPACPKQSQRISGCDWEDPWLSSFIDVRLSISNSERQQPPECQIADLLDT